MGKKLNDLAGEVAGRVGGAAEKVGNAANTLGATGIGIATLFAELAGAPGKAAHFVGEQMANSDAIDWGSRYIREAFHYTYGARPLTEYDAGKVSRELRHLLRELQRSALRKRSWLRRGGTPLPIIGSRARVNRFRLTFELSGWEAAGEACYGECRIVAWNLRHLRYPLATESTPQFGTQPSEAAVAQQPDFVSILWNRVGNKSDVADIRVADVVNGCVRVANIVAKEARDCLNLLKESSERAPKSGVFLTEPSAVDEAARRTMELSAFVFLAVRALRTLLAQVEIRAVPARRSSRNSAQVSAPVTNEVPSLEASNAESDEVA